MGPVDKKPITAEIIITETWKLAEMFKIEINWKSKNFRLIAKIVLRYFKEFGRGVIPPPPPLAGIGLIKFQAFSLQVFSKETSIQLLPCEVSKTFKSVYFEEHLQTTASGGVYNKKSLQYLQNESG